MFKKILVPVDGSNSSWKALAYAEELANKFDGDLTVLTVAQVYRSATLVAMPLDNVFNTQDDGITESSKLVIASAKEKLAGFKGNVEYLLEKGHPSEKILSIAKNTESRFDAIVIGSRGLSGIAEFFLGSVSAKIAEHAKVPVVIVK